MKRTMLLDHRHKGETEETFTKHFKIFRAWYYVPDGRPWFLYWHLRAAGWKLLGSYETQQEAMKAIDLEWSR